MSGFILETGKLHEDYSIPMILHCPQCGARHIDESAFATVAHHTHACQNCGFVWRPAKVNTHGVRFLPGYSNEGQPMTDYKIWKPEHDGHAPPNWREGMKVAADGLSWTTAGRDWGPEWYEGQAYKVEPEALNSPNDDAADEYKERQLAYILEDLRQYSPELLAKHGITLAPEKDWATELWAELMDAWNYKSWAQGIRDGFIVDADQKAIELLRTRFEQMKGEG